MRMLTSWLKYSLLTFVHDDQLAHYQSLEQFYFSIFWDMYNVGSSEFQTKKDIRNVQV